MMEESLIEDLEEIVFFNKPSLVLRIKTMIIDSIVILILLFIAFKILNTLGVESGKIKGAVLGLILLYEPIFVSINKTIGQKIMGLRVRQSTGVIEKSQVKNINIISSFIRYIAKILLGWISLLTIHSSNYGQAIHDKMGGAIMILEK